ncbi:MAG: hypothetical protein HXS48_20015 [Theionarchaea archaeon]|nr:hypothetical protein [Theionarchaea archaeon]
MTLLNALKGKKPEQIENERNRHLADMVWIGVGNAGMKLLDKVCSLDIESNLHEIYPIGIRTSKFDCQSPKNIEQDQIIDLGEEKERRLAKGTGGDQSLAQKIFLKKKDVFLERIGQSTIESAPLFLLGSLAGGTAGGGIPVLAKLLKKNFPNNPVLIAGILPDPHEGSTLQANASRSLLFLEEYDALILFENRAIRSATIEEGFDILNDEFAETLYSLFAVRPEEYALNTQKMLNLTKRFGKEGICLTHRCVSEEIMLEEPKTDEEREVLKSDMVRLLKLNLSHYPEEVLRSARGGAYHIGSNRNFLLHDLVSLLSTTVEDLLGGNGALVVPGFWRSQDYLIEIVTTLVGVDSSKYEFAKRINGKWKILYEEDEIENSRGELLKI